jgi:cytochrome P450
VATTLPGTGGIASITTWEEKQAELVKCLTYFTGLWNQRINAPPANDLISMLAHAPATRNMGPKEFLGNLVLLIVGGNDTTRNSMTGGLLALNQNPAQFAKLRANPALVESMVPEIIRWQTPLAHMRRTALVDTELAGKQIKQGDKAFGFGIHRCVGNRLAEMQLKILWEEILKRFPVIEVVGEPTRVRSPFVRGFTHLPVRIPA